MLKKSRRRIADAIAAGLGLYREMAISAWSLVPSRPTIQAPAALEDARLA